MSAVELPLFPNLTHSIPVQSFHPTQRASAGAKPAPIQVQPPQKSHLPSVPATCPVCLFGRSCQLPLLVALAGGGGSFLGVLGRGGLVILLRGSIVWPAVNWISEEAVFFFFPLLPTFEKKRLKGGVLGAVAEQVLQRSSGSSVRPSVRPGWAGQVSTTGSAEHGVYGKKKMR